ncbi:hypothetical protein [Thermosporothrix hazakensis]|uniref:hypothetical protein n=1 Tax=Thermosporothrix hazakensis TaxID=644383 RepID=UPI001B85F203|nr:hypothetical protein [Thermosporothrix hazakensis]
MSIAPVFIEHAPVPDNNGYHLLLPACAYALTLSSEEDARHAVKYAIADERALLIFYPVGERLLTCAFVPSVPHWRLFIKELACIRGMSAQPRLRSKPQDPASDL